MGLFLGSTNLLSGGGGGQTLLPAPDVVNHASNPVTTTTTTMTLSPSVQNIDNFEDLTLTAFYIAGTTTDINNIVTNGTQAPEISISTPMAGNTANITVTGLTHNTAYSFVIALETADGGSYYVSDARTASTATDTAASATISVDEAAPAAGATVVFTVVTVDNEGDAVNVQWQYASDGTTFTNITGETGATYTISSYAAASHDGSYRVSAMSTIHPVVFSNVVAVAEAGAAPAPTEGGGLQQLTANSLLITNALGHSTTDATVSSSVFGSRYPRYGGQNVASGGTYNMSMITTGMNPGDVGSNFGNTAGITLAQFNAASTVTTNFPTGEGTAIVSANGFNTAMGVSGTAPTTAGVYNINVTLDANGESGLYQLRVGNGGTTTTHNTTVNVTASGTASFFASTFIGLPGTSPQAFTLGPSTANTSADCFIATTFPADLNTVAVTLDNATAQISTSYAGFSGNIRWFGFRGVPSVLGTTAIGMTVNGVASNTGPPLISAFNGSVDAGSLNEAANTATVSGTVTIGSIGGSAITSVVVNSNGGLTTTIPTPSGGWTIGDHAFSNIAVNTRTDHAVVISATVTNGDGSFTTILNTFT